MENKKLEIKKVEIKMKNGSVISQPNQSNEQVKRSSRFPFENKKEVEIIEGDVFIAQQTLNFLHHDNPQVDNDEVDEMLNKVTYNKEVNTDFDFIYQDAVVCDGTMMFIWNVQTKMFGNLLAGRIVLADDIDKDNSNIAYQIGDVTIEIENNVETDKPFPMSKYTINIPTKVIKL